MQGKMGCDLKMCKIPREKQSDLSVEKRSSIIFSTDKTLGK